ncbi:hypothetical protein [Nibricoccus sp. IMCC34717]|uniref:hypothetical protein n=1 Tax=Nibricoccus sp. IMCC34717 TaxID=3034021 RepID=UPI00384EC10F
MTPRPTTLKEVAEQSASLADFGRHLRDWLHEVRKISSRPSAARLILEEPPRLRRKFRGGEVADAWLAAYAEHLSTEAGIQPPDWAFKSVRKLPEPSFNEPDESPTLRILALRDAPLAFKRRNLFTPSVDLPLSLRAGRPRKSATEKRLANAARQRRFREKRAAELKALRAMAQKNRR